MLSNFRRLTQQSNSTQLGSTQMTIWFVLCRKSRRTLAHVYLLRDSPIRPTAPQNRQVELVSGFS